MITEEIEIFYVEVRSKVTNEIITDVRVGNSYQQAVTEKDALDMVWNDGSTYTAIVSDWEEEKTQ